MNDVAAIVLAAGRSRRMGKFKPLLPFGATTVIESCVNNLRSAGIDEIVIVVGHRAGEVRRQMKSARVSLVTNPDPDGDMSGSVALGAGALSDTVRAVLVTPVDHPAVPPDIIRLLVERWRLGAQLVQPEFAGRGGHPVLIDLSFRKALLNLDSKAGLRGFFAAQRPHVLRLPVPSPFVARDMDTWEDYCALHQEVFGLKPEEKAAANEPNV